MAIADRVSAMALPLLEPLGLDLYDVEVNGGVLRITVQSADGVNLDQLAEATKVLSRSFDETDPMPGSYTLEVSSPGLERRLRKPEHFAGAIGEELSIKLGPHVESDRRFGGELLSAADDTIVIVDQDGAQHTIALSDITTAKTVFGWEPAPKPGKSAKRNDQERKSGEASLDSPDAEGRAAAR